MIAGALPASPPPAEQLLGMKLDGDWHVVEKLPRKAGATGGTFSVGYIVERPDGSRAFLKALDFSSALLSPDPAGMLLILTQAYTFERDLLARCRARRLDRVVQAISDGTVRVDATPAGVVQYLVFELADGDVRTQMHAARAFDEAWALRSLHHIATGLRQLHGQGIAHQDVKPSNVMVFGARYSKLGDLGRASALGESPPHEAMPVAGDRTYAPPELLYRAGPTEWSERRYGCDAYLLGSMVVFMFTGVSMTALILAELDPAHRVGAWRGTYADVLPFIRDAFARAVQRFSASVPDSLRPDLVEIVHQLCDPDPKFRGHPKTRGNPVTQFSLERYMSRFNLLAARAEYTMGRRPK
jgi:serine/threonine protein kinase